ncbi:MAG: putative glycoside hydrolase [Candidatus Uhrbacteria bacterium]|nr:putative glycoside hydrolase [Candidatus Uhrbacteria bacterium]
MFTKRQIEFLVPAFLICLLAAPFFIALGSDRSYRTDRTYDLLEMQPVENIQTSQHIPLPDEVRGIYWTAVTATTGRADALLGYMLASGLNTVVIDVKMDNGELVDVAEFKDVLAKLYDAGIYRIARIAVMRDSAFAEAHPNLALGSGLDSGIWRDNTGATWLDPAAPEVADYAIELGRQFYKAGFDEIQYDYVRFASDGVLSSIVYPVYDARNLKIEVMQRFFERVGGAMQEDGIPVSFDVFGMTFWSHHDYNIGQRLIDVLPYADFVSPMVYPSHYVDGFKGYANPALVPYEIVKMSLDEGLRFTHGVYAGSDEELAARFRPWLQDFDIGVVYTSPYIEAQIQAARDAGASGWILWNARNVYEPAKYLPEPLL